MFESDEQLDALLRSAQWPAPDAAAEGRLRARLDAELAANERRSPWRVAAWAAVPLAAAAALAVGVTLWPKSTPPVEAPPAVAVITPPPPAIEKPTYPSRPAAAWEIALARAAGRPQEPSSPQVLADRAAAAQVAAWARQLGDLDVRRRESAARHLAESSDPRATAALAAALRDPIAQRPVLAALDAGGSPAAAKLLAAAGRDPILSAQLRSIRSVYLAAAGDAVTNPSYEF